MWCLVSFKRVRHLTLANQRTCSLATIHYMAVLCFAVEGEVQRVTASHVTFTFVVACCLLLLALIVGAEDAWSSSSCCRTWVKHEASQMCVVAFRQFCLVVEQRCSSCLPLCGLHDGGCLFICLLFALLVVCSLFGLLSVLLASWSLPGLLIVVSCCRVCGGCLQLRPPVASR